MKYWKITKDYRLEGEPLETERRLCFRFKGGFFEWHTIHQDALGMYIEVFYREHKARLDIRGLYAVRT